MKITQLEYFCAVARCHSITQAANQLYVTQPAISSAIKELEREFSINLLIRSKSNITLTKEGEIFYQKATNLLEMVHQTSSEMGDLAKKIAPLKIGIPPLLSTLFFPDLLQAFQEKYPDIPVELYEYASLKAASLVQDGALDVAMVNMDFYNIDKLNSYKLLTDQIVFVTAPDHPLAKNQELNAQQLENEPIILYNTDSVQNTSLMNYFKASGITPNVIMHASQLFTIHQFVKEKLGGAFLYSSLLKNLPDLVGIPVVPTIQQEIGFVWSKDKYLNNSVESFVSFTKRYKL